MNGTGEWSHAVRWVILLFAFLAALASPVSGQTTQPAVPLHRGYVAVSGFATVERFSLDRDATRNGTVGGLSVGAGMFATSEWTVEADIALPAFIDSGTHQNTTQVGSTPVDTFWRMRHQAATAAVLLGFHPPSGRRVRLALSAGVAAIRYRQVYDEREVRGDTVIRRADALSYYSISPVVQLEAWTPLTSRVAVTAYVRGLTFDFGGYKAVALRPGVALRLGL